MLRHEPGDMDLAEDPYWWMLRHEPDTWIRRHESCRGSWRSKDAETWIRRHGSCRGSWNTSGCWDMNPETWILQIIHIGGRWDMNRRHGSCRGSWDTYGCWYMDPETWILQRVLRYMWMLRHESGDMDLAEEPEIQRCWDMSLKTWIL